MMPGMLMTLAGAQAAFAAGDLLARHYLGRAGLSPGVFRTWWFAVYVMLRAAGTAGQLYVLSRFQLGRASAVFASCNLILSPLLGLLVLREQLPLQAYAGIVLAIAAVWIVALAG